MHDERNHTFTHTGKSLLKHSLVHSKRMCHSVRRNCRGIMNRVGRRAKNRNLCTNHIDQTITSETRDLRYRTELGSTLCNQLIRWWSDVVAIGQTSVEMNLCEACGRMLRNHCLGAGGGLLGR